MVSEDQTPALFYKSDRQIYFSPFLDDAHDYFHFSPSVDGSGEDEGLKVAALNKDERLRGYGAPPRNFRTVRFRAGDVAQSDNEDEESVSFGFRFEGRDYRFTLPLNERSRLYLSLLPELAFPVEAGWSPSREIRESMVSQVKSDFGGDGCASAR